jgi:hypothetical protein
MPANVACGYLQATAPRVPKTVERPPESGRLVGWSLISPLPRLQLPSQFTGFAQGYSGP